MQGLTDSPPTETVHEHCLESPPKEKGGVLIRQPTNIDGAESLKTRLNRQPLT